MTLLFLLPQVDVRVTVSQYVLYCPPNLLNSPPILIKRYQVLSGKD